ncbi:MAG TPA: hypothetical protein VEB21_08250 [Terriglobales bacterium]|nr:hypothetical protein [Terriglobales bacterium]
MFRKRLTASMVALALMVGVTLGNPAKAQAHHEWIYAGIAVGVYAVVVIVATAFIFDQPMTPGADQLEEAEAERTQFQVRPNCGAAADGNLNLICW